VRRSRTLDPLHLGDRHAKSAADLHEAELLIAQHASQFALADVPPPRHLGQRQRAGRRAVDGAGLSFHGGHRAVLLRAHRTSLSMGEWAVLVK